MLLRSLVSQINENDSPSPADIDKLRQHKQSLSTRAKTPTVKSLIAQIDAFLKANPQQAI